MSHIRDDDASTEVPRADRLEQERAADPGADQEPEWPASEATEVDEGELLEQSQPVLDDPDEEYAPDRDDRRPCASDTATPSTPSVWPVDRQSAKRC